MRKNLLGFPKELRTGRNRKWLIPNQPKCWKTIPLSTQTPNQWIAILLPMQTPLALTWKANCSNEEMSDESIIKKLLAKKCISFFWHSQTIWKIVIHSDPESFHLNEVTLQKFQWERNFIFSTPFITICIEQSIDQNVMSQIWIQHVTFLFHDIFNEHNALLLWNFLEFCTKPHWIVFCGLKMPTKFATVCSSVWWQWQFVILSFVHFVFTFLPHLCAVLSDLQCCWLFNPLWSSVSASFPFLPVQVFLSSICPPVGQEVLRLAMFTDHFFLLFPVLKAFSALFSNIEHGTTLPGTPNKNSLICFLSNQKFWYSFYNSRCIFFAKTFQNENFYCGSGTLVPRHFLLLCHEFACANDTVW